MKYILSNVKGQDNCFNDLKYSIVPSYPRFQLCLVWKYLMENSRNEQSLSSKSHAILSSVMKSRAIYLLCPSWDVIHPFVQRLHTVHTPLS